MVSEFLCERGKKKCRKYIKKKRRKEEKGKDAREEKGENKG